MLVENISDLVIFIHAAKAGSFSAAGRDLGFSAAVVSKRLQRLEDQLSVRLFNRSTRKIGLTDEGAAFFDYCVRVLADLEEAESLITKGSQQVKGLLRVTAPAAFGRLHIAPLVPILLSRHPSLELYLHLSDDVVDIIEDRYDVAVRIGEMKDSRLIARNLCVDNRLVVATESYIKKFGEPKTPEDLLKHNALLFCSSGKPGPWRFYDKLGKLYTVNVSGNFETNNCDALREAILADIGIALRPTWDIWRDVKSGRMVPLLPEYKPNSFYIKAVYQSRQHLPQKVRVLLDLLIANFGDVPYWDNITNN
ncbi:MAG: LysR family transcriptional regulator [Desulfomonilaceae bacterium]